MPDSAGITALMPHRSAIAGPRADPHEIVRFLDGLPDDAWETA